MSNENSQYRKAVSYLTEMIKTGELTQGAKLPAERTISESLQISRNSTREALRSLENMGIIESRRGSGNYLSGDISDSLSSMIRIMMMLGKFSEHEICDFRRGMEKTVCFSVIENCTDIKSLAGSAELLISQEHKTHEEEIDADRNFHYMLIEACENRLIISVMEAVTDIYREWIDSVITGADDELKLRLRGAHLDIIEGIRSRDRNECEKAIDVHYDLIDEVLENERRK